MNKIKSSLMDTAAISGSILDYALTVTNYQYIYTGSATTDLPDMAKYAIAKIYGRADRRFISIEGNDNKLHLNSYNGSTWKGWETCITNTDLTERFKPIRIFGTEGGTFSKTLKNKVYNSVVFLAFDTGVPDNPFSFEAEYAIAFHAGLLKAENVFTLIGFDSSALHPLEIKMLDLRS